MTWRGEKYGRYTERHIDYFCNDSRSTARVTKGMFCRPATVGRGMVGIELTLETDDWNTKEQRRRGAAKPAGWRLRDAASTVHDRTKRLQRQERLGAPLEACLRLEDRDRRRQIREVTRKRRANSKADMKYTQLEALLKGLRSGGWGNTVLAPKLEGMTTLKISEDEATHDESIDWQKATQCYRVLFEKQG